MDRYTREFVPYVRPCNGLTGKDFFDRLFSKLSGEDVCPLDVGMHVHKKCNHCKMEWTCKLPAEK
jgi:hypothetical protein